jgi:hypothetical protein
MKTLLCICFLQAPDTSRRPSDIGASEIVSRNDGDDPFASIVLLIVLVNCQHIFLILVLRSLPDISNLIYSCFMSIIVPLDFFHMEFTSDHTNLAT